jgi:hypothetical protein
MQRRVHPPPVRQAAAAHWNEQRFVRKSVGKHLRSVKFQLQHDAAAAQSKNQLATRMLFPQTVNTTTKESTRSG